MAAKQQCFGCKKPLTGQFIKVDNTNKLYHIQCFIVNCSECKNPVKKLCSYIRGKPYCETCYPLQIRSGRPCTACQKTIGDEAVESGGLLYHKTCFKCALCKQPISSGSPFIRSTSDVYHTACLVCSECRQKITEKMRFGSKKEILCAKCYAARNLPKCSVCKRAVEGECLQCGTVYYHEDCFKCQMCDRTLDSRFLAKEDKPFCDDECYQDFVTKSKPDKTMSSSKQSDSTEGKSESSKSGSSGSGSGSGSGSFSSSNRSARSSSSQSYDS